MIGYLTLGTNDLQRAGEFYDELLAEMGAQRTMTDERMLGWGTPEARIMFSVITPFDEQPASVGNGVMIALDARTPEMVERLYNKALELGASDEGHPHDRGSSMGFYGGYFRDLDGNKLVAYCLGYKPAAQ
jgi:predicted lactoylglutathione lyase